MDGSNVISFSFASGPGTRSPPMQGLGSGNDYGLYASATKEQCTVDPETGRRKMDGQHSSFTWIDDKRRPTERFRDLEARAPAEERFGSPRSRIDRYGDERAPGGAESFEHQDFGDGPTLPASPRRSLGSSRPVTDGFSTVDFLRDYLKDRPCPPSGHPDSVCYKIMKERDASAGFASVAHDRAAMTDSPLFRSSWDGDVPSRTYSSSRSPLSLNDRPSFGNVGGYDSGGDGLRSTSTYGATRQNPLGGGLRSTDQPYGGARDFASTAHYPSAPYPTSTYSTAFDGLDDGGGGGNGGDGGDYGGGGGDDGYFGGGGGWGDSGGGFSMGGDPRAYPSLSSRESGMLTGCSHSGGLGALCTHSRQAPGPRPRPPFDPNDPRSWSGYKPTWRGYVRG